MEFSTIIYKDKTYTLKKDFTGRKLLKGWGSKPTILLLGIPRATTGSRQTTIIQICN